MTAARAGEPERRPRALVAYASRNGATAGVAERIAGLLGAAGARVELRHVDDVERDVGDYDAVVLGSPVYDGAWPPEASAFVDRNRDALADRPVWLFSVGSFSDRHRLIGGLIRREPRGIGDVLGSVRPRDYRVFAGVVARDQWPLYGRLLLRALGGRIGDNRDWEQIEAWARAIGRALSGVTGRAAERA